jgi:signal transduction histidine kinase
MNATVPSAQWLERANHLALVARLLSGTVHDVNNLLQVISGQAELVELAAADRKSEQRGRTIRESARRASELLEAVMSFARDTRVVTEPVDMRESAERVLALRRYSIAKAKIQTVIDKGSGPALAHANPRVVLHIALNLIVNAEQALSGRHEGRLRVQCLTRDQHVELTVEDNGAGIPAELDVHAVLGGLDTDSAFTALGIGLTVSSWLARTQNGTLTHSSPPGGGCALTLVLPRAV